MFRSCGAFVDLLTPVPFLASLQKKFGWAVLRVMAGRVLLAIARIPRPVGILRFRKILRMLEFAKERGSVRTK